MGTESVNAGATMRRFVDIQVGEHAELSHTLTEADVATFAELTGDRNPLHVDPEFARQTTFRKPVVHGMLSASFISTMIGMILPGSGALWAAQTLDFLYPAFVGDTLRVAAQVKQKSPSTGALVLQIDITNQHDQRLLSGTATVKLLDTGTEPGTVAEGRQERPAAGSTAPARAAVRAVSGHLTGQTVLVTGGSGGIGAATVRRLAGEGHRVVIGYLHGAEAAAALVEEIGGAGGCALAVQADVANDEEVAGLFLAAVETFGPVQAVVHCAAPGNAPRTFDDLDWHTMQEQLDVQVRGAFNCARACLPGMTAAGSGSLVFVSSIYAEGTPPVQQARYVVAKAALSALARSLAAEYGPKGIRVNIVAPGMTETAMIAGLPEKTKLLARMQAPLRRLAAPEDVAAAIAFLLSPAARHVTGETLRVCGGSVM